jgi:phage gp16-like protein
MGQYLEKRMLFQQWQETAKVEGGMVWPYKTNEGGMIAENLLHWLPQERRRRNKKDDNV